LDAAEPVAVQPAVIDPLLEIDSHRAERRQRPAPVVARVDVVGADLADRLVHGSLSCTFLSFAAAPPTPRCRDYSKLFVAAVTGGLHNSVKEEAVHRAGGNAPCSMPLRSRASMRARPSRRSRAATTSPPTSSSAISRPGAPTRQRSSIPAAVGPM